MVSRPSLSRVVHELTDCRNFTKFLIDKEGNVVGRYGPSKTPKELVPEIEKVL